MPICPTRETPVPLLRKKSFSYLQLFYFFFNLSLVLHLLHSTQSYIMEEEYDYESLGQSSTMAQNATAGALAGIAEHCLMYPVDSIKVRTFFFFRGTDAVVFFAHSSGCYRQESRFFDQPLFWPMEQLRK